MSIKEQMAKNTSYADNVMVSKPEIVSEVQLKD